jgi:hypothetical protein
MATPATQLRSYRRGWIISALEAGIILPVFGLVLLSLNPFWHLDDAGFIDRRVFWWNGVGQVLIAAGFVILAVGIAAALAGLFSRCFKTRPAWPYVLAFVALAATAVFIGLDGFTRDFDARFEWNSGNGFRIFQLENAAPGNPPPQSFLWSSLVGLQVQPLLQGYFRLIDWQRVNGHIGVTVARVLPVAWPIALGHDGETLEDPDQTPLMQAAARADTRAVQQLLASGADVNARDQSGQTALIVACRTPHVPVALVKALLDAHADLNMRSHNEYTALSWATSRGNSEVANLLRRAGARP